MSSPEFGSIIKIILEEISLGRELIWHRGNSKCVSKFRIGVKEDCKHSLFISEVSLLIATILVSFRVDLSFSAVLRFSALPWFAEMTDRDFNSSRYRGLSFSSYSKEHGKSKLITRLNGLSKLCAISIHSSFSIRDFGLKLRNLGDQAQMSNSEGEFVVIIFGMVSPRLSSAFDQPVMDSLSFVLM
jgi:hypothetical protein